MGTARDVSSSSRVVSSGPPGRSGQGSPESRGRVAELPAKGGGEVAVARVAEIERDSGQVAAVVSQELQRRCQPQAVAVRVERRSRSAPEDPAEPEDRDSERGSEVRQWPPPLQRLGQKRLRFLGEGSFDSDRGGRGGSWKAAADPVRRRELAGEDFDRRLFDGGGVGAASGR